MGQYNSETGRHEGHLNWNDRLTIEKMLRQGYSKPQIARYLGVHHSTVYDECKRGEVELVDSELRPYKVYSPEAGRDYHRRAVKNMEKTPKIGKDHALANWLVDMIRNQKYSPEACVALIGKTPETTFSCTLCRQTVRKYIAKGDLWPLTNKDLRFGGKVKRKKKEVEPAARAPKGDSIERRPKDVKTRERAGDWEMDCVESCEGTPWAVLSPTERKTRFQLLFRIPHKNTESVVAVLDGLEERFGVKGFRRIFRSITVDNGSEFQDCAGMERSCIRTVRRTHLYYCHPRCPGERGSNEKQHQIVRWHFPKGTNFEEVTDERMREVQDWMNAYPRKILGWKNSALLFEEFLASVA